ncbi:hypothetical protein ISN45_Aa02g008320 [Arabidopsis thaliana x Arabidopsis arenosa]|uniref:Uncharacterized protein n=1 Tax=Arabidopsis thaliana x Arabidopsis arenosa TaxID=1240361 RepID=A0A8T2BDY0_9BRAS|nr:hypothetical protein ISN45_Aa02g008320 [Arabidopsis thaliana x Arabidopsis arenosa]
MERGKRVMQPEADFDLNMVPPEAAFDLNMELPKADSDLTIKSMDEKEDRIITMEEKTRICEIEAGLDHVMVTSKKERERKKELKKKLIEYIEEYDIPIETKKVEKIEDPNILCESIIFLKELMNMDPKVASAQSAFSNDKKN